jgi:hypothetical protein
MIIPGLRSGGGYLVGGRRYETSGRQLEVSAFDYFEVYGSDPPAIGESNTILWMSAVLRITDARAQPILILADSRFPQVASDHRVTAGLFGDASRDDGGTSVWSLGAWDGTDRLVYRTAVPAETAIPTLLVVRIRFGRVDAVDLWVDPPLGGDPGEPDASHVGEEGVDLSFRAFGFSAGADLRFSDLDSLRLGDSFEAVTPAP